jgi:hypothetical protein
MNNTTGLPLVVYLPQDGCNSHMLISQVHNASYESLVAARDPSDTTNLGDAAFQIEVTGATTGTSSGYTTVVYEPYLNGTSGSTEWEIHDVVAGKVWSTRPLTSGNCSHANPCSFSTFQSENPRAKVVDTKFKTGQNGGGAAGRVDVFVDDVQLNYARYDLGG